jgi:hypothetical protein
LGFTGRSAIEANVNKYTFVWRNSIKNNKGKMKTVGGPLVIYPTWFWLIDLLIKSKKEIKL